MEGEAHLGELPRRSPGGSACSDSNTTRSWADHGAVEDDRLRIAPGSECTSASTSQSGSLCGSLQCSARGVMQPRRSWSEADFQSSLPVVLDAASSHGSGSPKGSQAQSLMGSSRNATSEVDSQVGSMLNKCCAMLEDINDANLASKKLTSAQQAEGQMPEQQAKRSRVERSVTFTTDQPVMEQIPGSPSNASPAHSPAHNVVDTVGTVFAKVCALLVESEQAGTAATSALAEIVFLPGQTTLTPRGAEKFLLASGLVADSRAAVVEAARMLETLRPSLESIDGAISLFANASALVAHSEQATQRLEKSLSTLSDSLSNNSRDRPSSSESGTMSKKCVKPMPMLADELATRVTSPERNYRPQSANTAASSVSGSVHDDKAIAVEAWNDALDPRLVVGSARASSVQVSSGRIPSMREQMTPGSTNTNFVTGEGVNAAPGLPVEALAEQVAADQEDDGWLSMAPLSSGAAAVPGTAEASGPVREQGQDYHILSESKVRFFQQAARTSDQLASGDFGMSSILSGKDVDNTSGLADESTTFLDTSQTFLQMNSTDTSWMDSAHITAEGFDFKADFSGVPGMHLGSLPEICSQSGFESVRTRMTGADLNENRSLDLFLPQMIPDFSLAGQLQPVSAVESVRTEASYEERLLSWLDLEPDYCAVGEFDARLISSSGGAFDSRPTSSNFGVPQSVRTDASLEERIAAGLDIWPVEEDPEVAARRRALHGFSRSKTFNDKLGSNWSPKTADGEPLSSQEHDDSKENIGHEEYEKIYGELHEQPDVMPILPDRDFFEREDKFEKSIRQAEGPPGESDLKSEVAARKRKKKRRRKLKKREQRTEEEDDDAVRWKMTQEVLRLTYHMVVSKPAVYQDYRAPESANIVSHNDPAKKEERRKSARKSLGGGLALPNVSSHAKAKPKAKVKAKSARKEGSATMPGLDFEDAAEVQVNLDEWKKKEQEGRFDLNESLEAGNMLVEALKRRIVTDRSKVAKEAMPEVQRAMAIVQSSMKHHELILHAAETQHAIEVLVAVTKELKSAGLNDEARLSEHMELMMLAGIKAHNEATVMRVLAREFHGRNQANLALQKSAEVAERLQSEPGNEALAMMVAETVRAVQKELANDLMLDPRELLGLILNASNSVKALRRADREADAATLQRVVLGLEACLIKHQEIMDDEAVVSKYDMFDIKNFFVYERQAKDELQHADATAVKLADMLQKALVASHAKHHHISAHALQADHQLVAEVSHISTLIQEALTKGRMILDVSDMEKAARAAAAVHEKCEHRGFHDEADQTEVLMHELEEAMHKHDTATLHSVDAKAKLEEVSGLREYLNARTQARKDLQEVGKFQLALVRQSQRSRGEGLELEGSEELEEVMVNSLRQTNELITRGIIDMDSESIIAVHANMLEVAKTMKAADWGLESERLKNFAAKLQVHFDLPEMPSLGAGRRLRRNVTNTTEVAMKCILEQLSKSDVSPEERADLMKELAKIQQQNADRKAQLEADKKAGKIVDSKLARLEAIEAKAKVIEDEAKIQSILAQLSDSDLPPERRDDMIKELTEIQRRKNADLKEQIEADRKAGRKVDAEHLAAVVAMEAVVEDETKLENIMAQLSDPDLPPERRDELMKKLTEIQQANTALKEQLEADKRAGKNVDAELAVVAAMEAQAKVAGDEAEIQNIIAQLGNSNLPPGERDDLLKRLEEIKEKNGDIKEQLEADRKAGKNVDAQLAAVAAIEAQAKVAADKAEMQHIMACLSDPDVPPEKHAELLQKLSEIQERNSNVKEQLEADKKAGKNVDAELAAVAAMQAKAKVAADEAEIQSIMAQLSSNDIPQEKHDELIEKLAEIQKRNAGAKERLEAEKMSGKNVDAELAAFAAMEAQAKVAADKVEIQNIMAQMSESGASSENQDELLKRLAQIQESNSAIKEQLEADKKAGKNVDAELAAIAAVEAKAKVAADEAQIQNLMSQLNNPDLSQEERDALMKDLVDIQKKNADRREQLEADKKAGKNVDVELAAVAAMEAKAKVAQDDAEIQRVLAQLNKSDLSVEKRDDLTKELAEIQKKKNVNLKEQLEADKKAGKTIDAQHIATVAAMEAAVTDESKIESILVQLSNPELPAEKRTELMKELADMQEDSKALKAQLEADKKAGKNVDAELAVVAAMEAKAKVAGDQAEIQSILGQLRNSETPPEEREKLLSRLTEIQEKNADIKKQLEADKKAGKNVDAELAAVASLEAKAKVAADQSELQNILTQLSNPDTPPEKREKLLERLSEIEMKNADLKEQLEADRKAGKNVDAELAAVAAMEAKAKVSRDEAQTENILSQLNKADVPPEKRDELLMELKEIQKKNADIKEQLEADKRAGKNVDAELAAVAAMEAKAKVAAAEVEMQNIMEQLADPDVPLEKRQKLMEDLAQIQKQNAERMEQLEADKKAGKNVDAELAVVAAMDAKAKVAEGEAKIQDILSQLNDSGTPPGKRAELINELEALQAKKKVDLKEQLEAEMKAGKDVGAELAVIASTEATVAEDNVEIQNIMAQLSNTDLPLEERDTLMRNLAEIQSRNADLKEKLEADRMAGKNVEAAVAAVAAMEAKAKVAADEAAVQNILGQLSSSDLTPEKRDELLKDLAEIRSKNAALKEKLEADKKAGKNVDADIAAVAAIEARAQVAEDRVEMQNILSQLTDPKISEEKREQLMTDLAVKQGMPQEWSNQVVQQHEVTVPEGAKPGDMVTFVLPDGKVKQVRIPVDAKPGDKFFVMASPEMLAAVRPPSRTSSRGRTPPSMKGSRSDPTLLKNFKGVMHDGFGQALPGGMQGKSMSTGLLPSLSKGARNGRLRSKVAAQNGLPSIGEGTAMRYPLRPTSKPYQLTEHWRRNGSFPAMEETEKNIMLLSKYNVKGGIDMLQLLKDGRLPQFFCRPI